MSTEGWFLSRRESYVMVNPTGFNPEAKNQNIPILPTPTPQGKQFWNLLQILQVIKNIQIFLSPVQERTLPMERVFTVGYWQ